MNIFITFGLLAMFFLTIIAILQRSQQKDRTFTDYAVAGRSFDAKFQAMSFLNTWYPGSMFTAFAGMAAGVGVISFYVLLYSLLTVVVMYAMAKTVWIWGKAFDLRTQPDLFAVRYGTKHIRPVAGLIGIASAIPWLILGMQAMGELFYQLSFEKMSFTVAVAAGVLVLIVRQFWTIRMGMRGVIVSDMYQGIVAYGLGTAILVGMSVWLLVSKGASFGNMDSSMFTVPSSASPEGSLYFFSLLFTGAIGGWCLPFIFVRLFTADGVRSLKKSAAIAMPISLVFCGALLIFGMLASALPDVAASPEQVWLLATSDAGGALLLGLAGVVLLAASMGHADGSIQATGAQIANDLVGNYVQLTHKQLIVVSKVGMGVITLGCAWFATLNLPSLFTLATLAYQGVIQLAVPLFLGIWWKKGNRYGAIAGMSIGFVTAMTLEFAFPNYLPWAWGLSSGVVALALNLLIYVVLAYALPMSEEEEERVNGLFELVSDSAKSVAPAVPRSEDGNTAVIV
jgi:SSS family solute:Na+ symporter